MDKEGWKLIKGYEKYMVSNTGKVKSLDYMHTGREHILKTSLGNHGYVTVGLYNNGKPKKMLVHRLVAEAFIPNPDNFREVNHKDCNKENNNVDNLEWVTPKQNIKHAVDSGRINFTKFHQKGAEYIKEKSISVLAIDKSGNKYEFTSFVEAAKKLKVDASAICRVVQGKRKSAGGYIFKKIIKSACQKVVKDMS